MYKAFNKFILRTPVLSIKEIDTIYSNPTSYLNDESVLEALYVASPDFSDTIVKYRRGALVGKDLRNFIHTLVLYLSRMSSRCTPFGLFAKCSVGTIGKGHSMVVNSVFQRHTRLDHILICKLITLILKKDRTGSIILYPNTSLYRIGHKYRFIEVKNTLNRDFNLTEIDYSPILSQLLRASSGGNSNVELERFLMAKGYDEDESRTYISELVESQVLVNGVENLMTGKDSLDPLFHLIESLNQIEQQQIVDFMSSLKRDLDLLDSIRTNHSSIYDRIYGSVADIGIDVDRKHLFQVDCTGSSDDLCLDCSIASDVEKAVNFLSVISPTYEHPGMIFFKNTFKEMYGDRSVPLCEVLDPNLGIGYPNKKFLKDTPSILEGLVLPKENNSASYKELALDRLLISKLEKMYQEGNREIVLCDEDIAENKPNPYPNTVFSLTEISKVSDGHRIHIKAVAGNSAANLFSRFAPQDRRIGDLAQEIVDKEKEYYNDAVLAEIVHADGVRVGNVLFRPNMRDHEIVYLANSAIEQNRKIFVSDLELSLRNGYFYLYSTKLKKQVIPYFTNAVNYSRSALPIYRFLCDLQFDRSGNAMSFHWGVLNNKLAFYPRVRYNNCILSLAKWKVDVFSLIDLRKDYPYNDSLFLKRIDLWRSERDIPARVQYVSDDNAFPVDWTVVSSIDILLRLIKNEKTVYLYEYIFDNDDFIVRDENNNPYTNEFILCFYKEKH